MRPSALRHRILAPYVSATVEPQRKRACVWIVYFAQQNDKINVFRNYLYGYESGLSLFHCIIIHYICILFNIYLIFCKNKKIFALKMYIFMLAFHDAILYIIESLKTSAVRLTVQKMRKVRYIP